MSGSVSQLSDGQWRVSLTDNTTGQTFQTTVQYNSSMSSAEWIEEVPMSNRGLIPLDNFGSIQFTNATTTQNGTSVSIAQSGAKALTMTNYNGQALATPASLTSNGSGFNIIRSAVDSSIIIPTTYIIRVGMHRGSRTRMHFRFFD